MSEIKNAVANATTIEKVGIKVSETVKGNENWNYADLIGKKATVTNVAISKTKSKPNGKGNLSCFEITLEGREKPVRVLPSQALETGIASVEGDEVVITATSVTSNETGRQLLPA